MLLNFLFIEGESHRFFFQVFMLRNKYPLFTHYLSCEIDSDHIDILTEVEVEK